MSGKTPKRVPQNDTELANVLKELHDTPAGLDGVTEELLHVILDFVMRAPKIKDEYHWFCSKALPLLVEASTFILRLFAYQSSSDVDRMRERLSFVLDGCCDCITGFQSCKWSSRDTYFGCFDSLLIDQFWSHVDEWETAIVCAHLRATASSISRAKLTLNALPPPIVYHCVANPALLASVDIWDALSMFCPSTPISDWPTNECPGLLLLLAHPDVNVRTWANSQLARSHELTDVILSEDYKSVLVTLARAILPQHEQGPKTQSKAAVWDDRLVVGDSALWTAILSALSTVPPSLLKHRVTSHNRVYQVIISHLTDSGPHFEKVLLSFGVLLRKLGSDIWIHDGGEYPQVVFSSIKDNPAFVALLEAWDPSQEPWYFSWLESFILSVWNMTAFADVVANTVGFLCEELQHERFKKWHPLVMTAMAKILLNLMQKPGDTEHAKAIRASFDIHAKIIVNVALSPLSSSPPWAPARTATQSLLSHVLTTDIRDIQAKAYLLSSLADKESNLQSVPSVVFGKPLWELTFRSLDGNGLESSSIGFIAPIVALCSPLDILRYRSFPLPKAGTLQASFKMALSSINDALAFLQDSFEKFVDKFIASSASSKSLDMMSDQITVHSIMSFLFSPSPRLRQSAQAIILQAYGNDGGRADCFRVMLENSPEVVIKSLVKVNDSFSLWAVSLTEACNLSQTLVLCLSDILEVLCSRSGGLLFDNLFMYPPNKSRPARLLAALWTSMCKALSVIFKRTPHWSAYYENKIMVDWMRDALIFGRDLLNYRGILESAISAAELSTYSNLISSPRKLTPSGHQMVVDLQTVLTEVINWLRLTDSELLYQSFNLLRSLFECFRKTGTKPDSEPLQKLERFLDKARQRANMDDGDSTTRLSKVDLSSLSSDMSSFNDEEIQIIERSDFIVTGNKKRPSSPTGDVMVVKQPKNQASSSSSTSRPSDPKDSSSKISNLAPIFKPSVARATHLAISSAKPPVVSKKSNNKTRLPSKPAVAHPRPVFPTEPQKTFTIGPSESIRQEGQTKSSIKPDQVPASSGSGSEDEEDNYGLAGLDKVQRSPPRIRKPEERRQIKIISMSGQEIQRPGRNVLEDRTNKLDEARRISLRLKPDLTPLHRRILSWDYDNTTESPSGNHDTAPLSNVPQEFCDHGHYVRIFEPLLLHECWSQLAKSKEETTIPILACNITGKGYVDDWIEVEVVISEALPQKWFLADTDIVLLRHSSETVKKVLAKVHASTTANRGPSRELRVTLRCTTSVDPGVQVGTTWQLSKVFSLSTVHREFASLVALPYYDLFDDIVHPRPSRLPIFDMGDVQRAMHSHRVNEPQAKAILAAMQTEGFLLIQGPPGTGKTSTICGIVGSFLSNRPKPATTIQVGRVAAPGKPQIKKKILICAPSNAGIDEVAKRLRDGVLDSHGQRVVPQIVRIGIDSSINTSIKDLSLDFIVDQRLSGIGSGISSSDMKDDFKVLQTELHNVRTTLEKMYSEVKALKDRGASTATREDEISALKNKRLALSKRMDDARDKQKSDNRAVDAARRKFRAEVLQEADVICSTLAGAGHDILESFAFDTVVIDEAAQSIELSSLIPLKYGCKRCIMVGDPQQLPPTVISPIATRHNYNQSLFVRIYNLRRESAHLLSIQYRMHPEISRIPSQLFYQGRLVDGPDMETKTKQPWHDSILLSPYKFFNVARGKHDTANNGHSLINRAECDAALGLYELFLRNYRHIDMSYRVGIISMYKAQIGALRKAFENRYGPDLTAKIDFNTVDAFQGQEKDVIILSCVRAGPGVTSIGFLSDIRRLNVSITRARSSLFILGHAATLQRSDDTWRFIVEDAQQRSAFVEVDHTTFLSTGKVTAVQNLKPISRTTSKGKTREPLHEPSELLTPKALAVTVTGSPDRTRIPTSKRPADDDALELDHSTKRQRANESDDTPILNPATTDSTNKQPVASGTRIGDAPLKPRVPQARPKKAAASMFIPRKKHAPG